MKNTNIISVWQTLLSEGDEGAKAKASQYINESAARILKSLTEEDAAVEPTVSTGDNLITVTYDDPNGDCDFDDDVISASGKDDYDSAGWAKGKRIVSFLFDTTEEATQAAAQIGDLTDSVAGLAIVGDDNQTDLSGEVAEPTDDEEVEVTEAEEENLLSISFPSDGDTTVVDDFKNHGFNVLSTDVIDGHRHVVFKFGTEEEVTDAVPVVKDVLRGFGIEDYSINTDVEDKDSSSSAEYTDDGVVGEDADVTDTTDGEESPAADEPAEEGSDISGTFDALASDLEDLRAQLAAAGITLSDDVTLNGAGDEDSTDITGLEEAFLGYEDVKIPQNKDIATDTKSPLISTSTKDRLKPASPIKSPAGKLTGDGTKAETAPAVKDAPATKNTVKGNVEKTYTKVSKEGDASAKINSKEGFGEEGKDSIID